MHYSSRTQQGSCFLLQPGQSLRCLSMLLKRGWPIPSCVLDASSSLLAAVLPLQISQAYIAGDKSYGRVTMANIAPSSSIMWCVGERLNKCTAGCADEHNHWNTCFCS
jgi:hypothetical protein